MEERNPMALWCDIPDEGHRYPPRKVCASIRAEHGDLCAGDVVEYNGSLGVVEHHIEAGHTGQIILNGAFWVGKNPSEAIPAYFQLYWYEGSKYMEVESKDQLPSGVFFGTSILDSEAGQSMVLARLVAKKNI